MHGMYSAPSQPRRVRGDTSSGVEIGGTRFHTASVLSELPAIVDAWHLREGVGR